MSDLIPGTLYGYRQWLFSNKQLHPVAMNCAAPAWELGVWNTAQHPNPRRDDHELLGRDCACGFWAKYRYEPEPWAGMIIGGVIEAKGKVVLHEAGFRAEKARVVGLVRPEWLPRRSQWERELSAVPMFEIWAEAYEKFPPPDLEALGIPGRRAFRPHVVSGDWVRAGHTNWGHVHLSMAPRIVSENMENQIRQLLEGDPNG